MNEDKERGTWDILYQYGRKTGVCYCTKAVKCVYGQCGEYEDQNLWREWKIMVCLYVNNASFSSNKNLQNIVTRKLRQNNQIVVFEQECNVINFET